MTPGEKRSVTSSLKKAHLLFTENNSDVTSSFSSKNQWVSAFYSFWIQYSKENQLSWCFDKKTGMKNYEQYSDFKSEIEEKINELFASELANLSYRTTVLSSLNEVETKLKPIRSKKKRMRKKYEKKLQMIH